MTFWLGFVLGIFIAWALLGLALTAWLVCELKRNRTTGGKR